MKKMVSVVNEPSSIDILDTDSLQYSCTDT